MSNSLAYCVMTSITVRWKPTPMEHLIVPRSKGQSLSLTSKIRLKGLQLSNGLTYYTMASIRLRLRPTHTECPTQSDSFSVLIVKLGLNVNDRHNQAVQLIVPFRQLVWGGGQPVWSIFQRPAQRDSLSILPVNVLPQSKRSSLLCHGVNYGSKKFYNFGPKCLLLIFPFQSSTSFAQKTEGVNAIKLFLFITDE